jgi:hypothetical protein
MCAKHVRHEDSPGRQYARDLAKSRDEIIRRREVVHDEEAARDGAERVIRKRERASIPADEV